MGKNSSGEIKFNFGDIEGINTSSLEKMLNLEDQAIEKQNKINKNKITIKTDDKQLLKTVENLNKLANIKPNFKLDELKNNATLNNINELRNNVEELYNNELPRLKSELMDLYSGGLIHPEQYDFFSQKLDQLNSDTFKNQSIGFLNNFESNLKSEINQAEIFAKGAIDELYSNILGGEEGAQFIQRQYESLKNNINTFRNKGAYSSIDLQGKMYQLEDYLTVLDKVDDMTRVYDNVGNREFNMDSFIAMQSSLEAIGVDASELEGVLKQAFEPQAIENESQAVQTLIQNINQLKAAVIEIKNILQSISGSGNNTSQLLDNINRVSQLFDNIELGDEKIKNPIQTIIQQLDELQSSANNLDFSRVGTSIETLESTLSRLPEVMKTALMSINGLDINMSGLDKSQEQLASEIRLLNAYEQIYTRLISSSDTGISSLSRLDNRRRVFNIDEFEGTLEKIAAYEAQFDLINKRLASNPKYSKTVNTGKVGTDWANNLKTQAMTWQDLVDKSLVKELRGAKQSRGLRRNQDIKKQQELIESMQTGNITAETIAGKIDGSINLSSLGDLTKTLNTVIEQLDYISQVLTLINNNIVDGFKFQESEAQLDGLLSKIKELETELLKVQQESKNAFTTSEMGEQYTAQIESAEKLVEAEEKVAEASQKAKQAVAENKTDAGASATSESVESEAKAMQEAGEAARTAAAGKDRFAEANQQVASSAGASTEAANAEASAIANVGKVSDETLDKVITYKRPDSNGILQEQNMQKITSEKESNKYKTVKKNYKAQYDDDGNYIGFNEKEPSSIEIIEDFKKIRTEQANAQKKIELAQSKLKTWFRSVENQTFGKANYIGEYEEMVAAYGRDASGLTTMDDLEKALNGMEKVQARVKEIQREMTKGNTSSLNPWQNASIAESSLSTSVDELERDASRLKVLPKEISDSIIQINSELQRFQGLSLDKDPNKTRVSIDEYAKSFGDLALHIRNARTAIKDQRIYESTNAVYDPYTELTGQINRYGKVKERIKRTELKGNTIGNESYKADLAEIETIENRILELQGEISSRPFFDGTKLEEANTKLLNINQRLVDIERQHDLSAKKSSDMQKMSADEFNNSVKNYETMVRGYLSGENLTPLNDNVIVNFSNGIAKVSAQVKDMDGNWRKFTADVDKSGNLLNIKAPFANSKEQAKFNDAAAIQNAQKFTFESFNQQMSTIASTYGNMLSSNGYQLLGEAPSVELLENGLARVSAKIKDAQGNWSSFRATVDASGAQINNYTLKPITSNIENLERQLAGGTLASDFTDKAVASYTKLFSKLKEGAAGYQELKAREEEFRIGASQVSDQESLDAFNKKLLEAESTYTRLNQLQRSAGKNSTLFGNVGQYENIEKAVEAAKQYATTMGQVRSVTGQINSKQINQGGIGQFTIQVKTAEGEVRNLKFAYDDMQNSMMSNASVRGIERTGLLGYFDRVQAKLQNLTAYWTAMVLNPYMMIGRFKEMVNVVVELDDALVDLQKTTTMNSADLNSFYYDANESAKKLGVSTKEIISQAADWSRLGYSDKESATRMAELSSQFASISPGMDVGTATEGLVSVMKAFDIETDDVKENVMSKINAVGNAFAETNANVITGLEKSSSAMAAANNTMDQTVALFTAGQEIVQNAETVGSSLRTISMRIRGYDEETEELSEEYENLSGDIADLTKTASTPGGISLFTDSSKTEYKSTYEILRDISKIYDELTDKEQAQLLQKLFGKTRAQTGAAILSNFDQAEKAMQVMRDSAGSADREMGIIEESLNYKINAFKETWTGFLQELIDRGLVGQIVDFFTMLSELVTNLTSSFGALDTVMSGLIAFSVTKFMGKGFINYNKENGFSFANPFSKDKADETIEESESARKTKEIETNVTNVETKIDELNAKEITLGSNEPAISNLEQVKTEIQEIITLEQEAANAFQATQTNINRMNVNGAMNADNIDYLLNVGEIEDELDDIGRTFSDSIESAPIANTLNNVIDDQAKAWQELVEENTDVRITPYVEKKDIDAVSNDIETEIYNNNKHNKSKKGRRMSARQLRNQQNRSQSQIPTNGWEELATGEDRFVDTGNRATMVLESQSAAAESAATSAQAHAVAITEEASAWESLATSGETASTSYAVTTSAHEQSAIAAQESAIANTEDAVSATENAVANTTAGMAAMENSASQQSVATSALQASVGLEKATLAADEEAAAMQRAALESGNAANMIGQASGNVSMIPSFLSGGLSKVLSLGGSVISMLGNMAIAMLAFKAVAGIFSFIDKNIIHYNENMIKAGKEATDAIDKTVEDYEKKTNDITSISESLIDSKDGNKKLETTSDAIDNLAEKYTKLSMGVDKVSNKNLSLSDEDYNTFLDTSNKIAEIMPELATGTDSAGNSILNLGNNAEEAAEKMHTVLDAQQQMAKSDLLNNLVAQRNGILSQNSVYQKQLNKNRQSQGEAAWIFNPSNAAYYTEEELAKMEYNAKARINNLKKDEQNIQKQMKDNWKSFIPTIQDLLKLDSDFSGLNLDIQSQLLDSIGNLDTSAISKMVKNHAGNADEFTAYLNDTFIAPFQELEERGMTDRLTALFDFDNTKMTLQEYKDYINDELMTIFSTDKSQVPVWKSILGLDDLKEQQKRIDNVLSDATDDLNVTKEQFDSLTMGDRNIAYDLIVNDKFEGTFSELKKRIKETKAELNEQDLFGTPLLDKYNEAVKEVSDNGGDVGKNFDAYGAALKSLKEQYDKGLVGTDTFKKGARMFSDVGATDADSFIKNYKKISKYFNEDDPAKGINKFLKDMEKLSLVKFNEDGSFVTTFDDIREGAQKAKMPLELFISMFDKIEEFGGYNDFFANKSEGFATVGEITGELAAARAEYEKLLDTQPKNKSAIKAKEEEIKSLEDRLKAAQKTLKDFVNGDTIKEYTENYKGQRKAAQDTLKGLNDSKNFKNASDDDKKVMLEAIKSGFENSGLDSSVYKNLGINKNGRIVLDVSASNRRIDNVLDLYDNGNGDVNKKLQEYGGRTVEQVVSMFAKEMGMSVEDYIKKVTGGTEGTETTSQEPTDPMEKYNQTVQDSTSASRDNTNATKELTGAINTLINKDNPTERDKGIGVDLTNRPLVPSVIMNNNGWDNEKGSLSTVNTVGYTDENGKEYVVTPILPNGKVLSPEELDSYMKDIMNGGEDKEGLVLSTFTGGNARKAADDYAEALHSVQEAYYLGDDATKQSLTTLQDYTAEELRAIDLTDNFQTDMEGQFVDLMKSLNISEDQVEQFINVLEDMGLLKIEPEVDLSQIDDVSQLNDTIAGQLSVGQSMTYTADVEGVETEVKAVEEQEGVIKYTAEDLDGVQKEVEPYTKQDGTISYKFVPDKNSEKDKDGKKNEDGGTITQKTDVDTSGFKKGQKEVQQGVQTLSAEKATPQVNLEGATYASSQIRNLINEADRLNGKKSTMTIETIRREVIEKKYNNTHKPEGGNTKHKKFNGTFHTSNAYASGTVVSSNVSIQKDETALINELGKEMIVRDGKALTFNSGYPTFANLKKGDVVFNHKQTEELEKKGYVTGSHAKLYGTSAFASGTVDDEDEFEELSNAYANTNISGGPKITSHTTTKKKSSSKKSTSNNNTNTRDGGGKGKGKGKGKKKSSGDKKWDQFEKWLGQFFDWIEIRLDALSTKTEKWTNYFEKFLNASSTNAQKAYTAAMNAAKTEQNQAGTASDRYLRQALKVGYKGADKAGKKVTRAWVDSMYQRILDGSLDKKALERLSEKRKGIIEAMQGYIDKAKSAADSTEELTDSINDLIKAQRDAKIEFRNNQYSSAVEGNNGYTASTRNSGLTSSSMAAQYSIDAYNNSVNQGQSYLGQLGSTAISASNTKDATNKKILKTLKGNNKKSYKNNLSSATSAIRGGKAISESVINYFRKMNPTLAAKYTAWNTQLVNQQNARIEAADNFGKSMETIIGNIQQSYANIDEDTERAISLAQSQADNQSDYKEANKILDKLYQYQADIIANDEAEIRTYANMRTSYANGVKSANYGGTNVGSLDIASQNVITNLRNQIVGIVNKGQMIPDTTMETLYAYYSQGYVSASFYEACRAYNMAYARGEEAQAQLEIDKEAQKQANRENFSSQISNIQANYDNQVSKVEALKNSIAGSYDDSVTQGNTIKLREKEYKELQDAFQKALDTGVIEKGSKEWYEYAIKIQEVKNEANELKQTKFETVLAEKFDRAIEKAQEFIDKLETINGLITDEMLYEKDSGQLTSYGLMSLGLNSQSIASEQNNLEKYFAKRQEIIDEYAKGNTSYFGDQSFDEMITQNAKDILDSISSINSYRESIINLIEGMRDAELEALQKVIDKRKDALSAKKSYYDYDRTIKGKTKDIQSLEQQIRALEGVAGQEAAAKRANLMAQRNEMQEDLDETVKEHIYNMQIEGLDDMMDGLQEDLQEWKDKLHADLDMQTSAINDILKQLNGGSASAGTISTLLSDISGKLISSDDVTSILKEASKTMSNYNTYNIDNNYSGENVDESNKTSKGASNNVDKAPTTSTTFETSANPNSSDKAPTGNVASNPTAQYGERTASGYAPATLTTTTRRVVTTTTTTTKKWTVTATQAENALSYIMNHVRYASKQNSKWGNFNKALYNHNKNRKIMIESSDATEAWKKLGFGAGSYTPQKLLDATKSSGIWDVLIQIKTDKNGNITYPTWNAVHGYAKGGTVHKSGRYLTDEKGEEIIITKQGILRPLSAGTSVIPADITERLYAIASNYDMSANAKIHGIDTSKLTRIGGETISPIINCPITIEGNANEQDVINAINKTLPKISKHVQNDIRKDLRKSGR